MKKHLFFAATAALVLASCSSDSVDFTQADVLQAQDDNSVQFDTYMGKVASTRATDPYSKGPIVNGEPSNANSLKNAKFGVFAYQTTSDYVNTPSTSLAPNFMYNQEITWHASAPEAWVYTPVKYWPNGNDAANAVNDPSNTALQDATYAKKLSFFAYAPYKAMADFSEAGTGTVGTDFPSVLGANTAFKTISGIAADTYGIVAMTTNEFTGNVWVKYLMPNANQDEAVDLLWGTNGRKSYYETDGSNPTLSAIGDGYNMNLTKQIVGEKVKFLFKHALAKIGGATSTSTESFDGDPAKCGFKVMVDVDGNSGDSQNSFLGSAFTNNKTLVTLKEVKIQDGKSASSDGDVSVTGKESTLYKSGWFNIEQGTWDMTGATKGATYNVTANSTDDVLTNTTYTLNEKIKEAETYGKYGSAKAKMLKDAAGAEWSESNPTGVTATAQDLFCNENVPGLMVIPGGSSTLYITVDYVVRTADPNLSKGYTEVEQKITNEVSLASLESNKYYTIIMHLGLTSVKFEAVVSDWEMYSDSSIDEDGHETGGTNVNKASVWLPSNVVDAAITTAEQTKAVGTVDVPLTGLQGSTLTVSSVDGDMVENIGDVTNLTITAGSATVHIAYKANAGAARDGKVVLSDGHKTITITIPQATGL